jgi:predicted Fe-Mo cluster-binding NifX family protein
MLGAMVVSGAVPLAFSHFELRAGRASNSPALVADALEYRVHFLTTGLALASLASIRLGIPVDRGAALLIVVVVAKTGWTLLRDAMRVLLDASLDAETIFQVRSIIAGDPAIADVKWVTGRNAGRFRFVEAPTTAFVRHAVPLADLQGSVSPHFGEAPYFALVDVRRNDGVVAEQRTVANPHRLDDTKKGIRVAEWLVAHKVDVVTVGEDLHGKGPEYVLHDAGVALRRADATTIADAIARGDVPSDRQPPSLVGSP